MSSCPFGFLAKPFLSKPKGWTDFARRSIFTVRLLPPSGVDANGRAALWLDRRSSKSRIRTSGFRSLRALAVESFLGSTWVLSSSSLGRYLPHFIPVIESRGVELRHGIELVVGSVPRMNSLGPVDFELFEPEDDQSSGGIFITYQAAIA